MILSFKMFDAEQSKSKSSFVSVNQCRFCGAIIPSSKGVERHGEVCRFLNKIPSNNRFQGMINVNFPCPTVIIERFIPPPKPERREIETPCPGNDENTAPIHSRRKSSLRALENLRRMSSTKDDGDVDQSKESEDDEIDFTDTDNESYSESDNDSDSVPKSISKGKRKASNVQSNGNDRSKIASTEKTKTSPISYAYTNGYGKYPCPYEGCSSILHSVFKLKEHFLTHLENSPFACPYSGCDKKMRGQSHFQEHMDWHEGKHLKWCEKCGRFVSSLKKKNWERHICQSGYRKRKGVPSGFYDAGSYSRYKYGVSNSDGVDKAKEILQKRQKQTITEIIASDPVFHKVCKDNPSFKDLILTNQKLNSSFKNANSEKYKCSKCSHYFSKMKSLRIHILAIHTNRPWRCSKCGRSFLKECFLKAHVKSHKSSGNEMYMRVGDNGRWSCTKCGFQSKFDASVRRHWRLVHKIDIPHLRTKPDKAERTRNRKSKSKRKKAALESTSESERYSDMDQEHEESLSDKDRVVKDKKSAKKRSTSTGSAKKLLKHKSKLKKKVSESESDSVSNVEYEESIENVTVTVKNEKTESPSVLKIESELAVEVVMIKTEDLKVDHSVKEEVVI